MGNTHELLNEKLETIRDLKAGWVCGALPISDDIIERVKVLVDNCSDGELSDWDVAPFINGTIILNYEKGKVNSSVTIGENTIGGFVNGKGRYESWYEQVNNSDEALTVFNKIKDYLNNV